MAPDNSGAIFVYIIFVEKQYFVSLSIAFYKRHKILCLYGVRQFSFL